MAAFFSMLPSIPYPPEQHGRWSPVTSTLDWCEEVCKRAVWGICANALLELCCDGVLGGDCQYFDQSTVYVLGLQGYSKLLETWT